MSPRTPTGIFVGPKKLIIIRLRWLVIIATSCLLLFANEVLLSLRVIDTLVLLYLLTNISLYYVQGGVFNLPSFYSSFVIFDTVALTFSLIVTGQLQSDFYLLYFLLIILAAFWGEVRWSLGLSIFIILFYGAVLFLGEARDTITYLRVPFLFIASLFYNYVTETVRIEKTRAERAEQTAGTDFLTGLPNRRAFEQKIEEEFDRANRYKRPLSILMADIDFFKRVNDTYGHQWGDNVLKKVGECLNGMLRRSDFAARYGGEEFVLVLPETRQENATIVAQRFRVAMKQTTFIAPTGSFSVTMSVGISSIAAKEYLDYRQLLADSDQALYHAKNRGRDRVDVFNPYETSSDVRGGT
ncbi:MAG: GGDEF domain-containing protein [Candidatus Binatia bacterium]